jgi:hypothetical protein
MSNNIRYINDYKTVELPDKTKVFAKGCFNCKNMKEKLSTVSGRCLFIPDESQYNIWKDFTCDMHNPIILE